MNTESSQQPVLLVVRSEPSSPEMLQAYHRWYADHVRKLLAVPGVNSARRFESTEGDMRFMAMYDIADAGVFESEPYRAVGRFGELEAHVRYTRNVYREIPLDHGAA